jgi:hypothetical protein
MLKFVEEFSTIQKSRAINFQSKVTQKDLGFLLTLQIELES